MFNRLIQFIREQYCSKDYIPLHAPTFSGREKDYLSDTIDSTYVSSVGAYVDRFEQGVATYTGARRAIATTNGTAALHISLLLAGVRPGDRVITQALTFVATCNAISYCGAIPIFIDIDRHTLGLSPAAAESWLDQHAFVDDEGLCRTRSDGQVIRACVPMHTFGHPADLEGLTRLCERWGMTLVEDAAESLGSFYGGQHTGTFGRLGALSFNGNKIITTGGGGMILADETLASRAKHLTTTAKLPHPYEYVHNELGFNYRMPNLNAALGCAQLESLDAFIISKRRLAANYAEHFAQSDLHFVTEPPGCRSNYWLNAVLCETRAQRDALLEATNTAGIMTRPAWTLMTHLSMYSSCISDQQKNAQWLSERIVNLPSSPLPARKT